MCSMIMKKAESIQKCYIFTCESIKYNLFSHVKIYAFQICIIFYEYVSIFHDIYIIKITISL